MKSQVVVLYATQYEITDEKTGKLNRGTSISYLLNTELNTEDNTNGSKGMRPAKCSGDYLLMGKIKKAPALYDVEMSMTVASNNKPVLSIVDLDYVSDVTIIVLEPESKASTSATSSNASASAK